jgi:hypothetical protein
MGPKEDDMPSTLTPTCPSCGLRFGSRPLLVLHIGEDHRQRDHAQPGRTDPVNAGTSQARTDGTARTYPATRPPSTAKEVITMTAAHQRHLRFGWAVTAWRAMIRTLGYVNSELFLASQAIIFRPAGAARSRSGEDLPAGTHSDATADLQRADRAA